MRVLHLGRDLAPRINGGLSVAVAGLLRAFAAGPQLATCAAWSFDAWRPKANSGRPEASPPTWHAEESGSVLRIEKPSQLEPARRLCRDWAPDLLHVHHAMLWEEACLLSAGRLPRLYHVHTLQAEQERLRGQTEPTLSSSAEARALAQAEAVIAPSRAAAATLLHHLPELESRLQVIGLGVDPPPPADEQAARAPHILVAGRFSDVKGTDLLAEILPTIFRRHPEIRLRLAGGCPENPRAQRRWLRRLEESLGEDWARVEFLGWLSKEDLAEEYRQARLLLCPSRFETFGQSVAEAMAHGVCVVATRAGGLEELIEDGVVGRLCDVNDRQALSAACIDLLRQPAEAQGLGLAAARRAQAWSWSEVAQEIQRLYARLMPDPREST